ncbi:type I polyketide synthase [Streptomyces rishiriensis]|uniref:Acyl transferase domain-containing protein n=1 Tax=Streptomyces rishiriensis TaxID=68264 RepID=A0ABU0P1P9_STRRH|nr:beta-ketoacyl synthase N-terminal-like domain-containing protein [Streptomyces rishiriensis]MDQ0585320.1 acyl transferase domain-containing protein [Streptomyces rishiriensis]
MADEEKLRQYLKKATGDLQRMALKLHEAELRDSEPVAIVGMGCRFPPDLRSAADLWRFVADERDGISPFPDDRGWGAVVVPDGGTPATPEPTAYQGGFVAGADRFDAEFFGIGEHEALAMDPQQRLLLETAWDAVEHAGLDPAGLRGTRTGVYAGVSYCHYGAGPDAVLPAGVEDQLIVGGAPSTTSGRVAYVMGLHGPAISIDTACSSSLVAIHQACQALRRGDCELALAGGVTIMATPDVVIEFGRRGALARDGRCKPFAAAADGMGFGEGAGLLVLERLSVALRNGHDVLAVIRGSAVNQDGATNGLTSPSRAAQEAVIRQALATAGLTPDQVDAVEGHGTGTPLGDSIEAEALIATYGENRTADRPLRLGSVKSNIGHTQTASGVASVIKMVMSLRARTHARTLHVDQPSTYVDWSGGTVALTDESVPWPAGGRPRRAGVSSFGISGTNAHLILEEHAAADGASAPAPATPDDAPTPWVLSAKTEPALRAMAAQLGDFLTAHPAPTAAVGQSLARMRAGFGHRAVSTGASADEHLAALAALARGEDAPGLITGAVTAGKTAVVFTGGEPGTGDSVRRLADRFPAFAEAYDDVRRCLEARLDRPLTAYRHATVFAHQVALYRVIRSCGVVPDLLAGADIGELTAAHVAGVLSLDDAGALAAAAYAFDTGDDGAGERLRGTAERIGYAQPRIPLVSRGEPGRPDHWATGDFLRTGTEDVLSGVRSQGVTACLELDPGAVVTVGRVLELLATAYTAGATVSWGVCAGTDAGRVRLPGYPFQRKRYWLEAPVARSRGGHDVVRQPVHPLLGGAVDLADATERWYVRTAPDRGPWHVAQYRLRGTPVLPPAAVAEWALAAARHAASCGDRDGGGARTIENLTFGEPVTLHGTQVPALQTAAEPHGTVLRIRGFSAKPGDAGHGWTLRFTASATEDIPPVPSPADLERLRSRMTEQDPGTPAARLGDAGITCGPAFRDATRRWWQADNEALALIETDVAATDGEPYLIHPVVLETCFLTALPLVADADTGTAVWLPAGLSRLTRHRDLPPRMWCHVRRTADGPVDLELYSDTGEPLVTVTGLTYRASDLAAQAGSRAEPSDAGPWDADGLSRLAVEDPQTARGTLTDLLFTRVTALVEGLADDRESLRARFAGARLGDLGMDSLRTMGLREQFRTELRVDVPPQRLLGDTTVADIVDLVCRTLAARSLVVDDEEPEAAGMIEELIL